MPLPRSSTDVGSGIAGVTVTDACAFVIAPATRVNPSAPPNANAPTRGKLTGPAEVEQTVEVPAGAVQGGVARMVVGTPVSELAALPKPLNVSVMFADEVIRSTPCAAVSGSGVPAGRVKLLTANRTAMVLEPLEVLLTVVFVSVANPRALVPGELLVSCTPTVEPPPKETPLTVPVKEIVFPPATAVKPAPQFVAVKAAEVLQVTGVPLTSMVKSASARANGVIVTIKPAATSIVNRILFMWRSLCLSKYESCRLEQ